MRTLQEQRVELLARLCKTLRSVPGARELYLFGSCAKGTADDYADLDLQLVPEAAARLLALLGQVGRLEFTYELSRSDHDLAFTVLFEGYSPYLKVDVGICDRQHMEGSQAMFGPVRSLWAQARAAALTQPLDGRAVFQPEPGSLGYFLLGELISATRYVKARRRGQHLTCWRFLAARVNALAQLLGYAAGAPMKLGSRLVTPEFVDLDGRLPEAVRLQVLGCLEGGRQGGWMERMLN